MPRPPVTVTVITLNEERNIARALKSAAWAEERLVVDSGSTDRTLEIARSLGARVLQNPWPGYGKQKNFAQDHASHDWVLNIDADEEITPELAAELNQELTAIGEGGSRISGFRVPRKTRYLGRWILHGGWYPNRLSRMGDKRVARWTEPQVHEELRIRGEVRDLRNPLFHYTFASIRDQVMTNLQFSRLGFEDLKRRGRRPSFSRLILKPIGKFIETYVLKRGFLDGLPGFIISVNAAHSMFLKYAFLYEAEIAPNEDPDRR